MARYEPAHPSGEHHHHVVCDSCGTVEPFEDAALERAIHRLSDKVSFDVAAHDVTLHGTCPACRASDLRRQTSEAPDVPPLRPSAIVRVFASIDST